MRGCRSALISVFAGEHAASGFTDNCYSDYAQRNAETLLELLGEDPD